MTQIACDSQAKAPDGCTQYYTGSTTNTVNSYNYQSGSGYQLANQQQTICVRYDIALIFDFPKIPRTTILDVESGFLESS